MSIILKGIDLPKHGETKRIVLYDNGDIILNEDGWDEDGNRFYKTSYDVQAIQIPKDHGRIIDEREAIRGWCKGCAFNDGTCGKDETICEDKEMCKYAPTILEAEE